MCLLPGIVIAQSEIPEESPVELVRITPEPFDDFLLFEFDVKDEGIHEVKIMIRNSINELVFMEKVQVSEGQEAIRIETVNFFQTGIYGIKVKIDHKYTVVRKFKHVH
ncbi:MAG: hypothetical protein JNM00_10355 [Flavobacteriales bacterium]|nr:hypothetical protein [Flavobacteriales bacterium]